MDQDAILATCIALAVFGGGGLFMILMRLKCIYSERPSIEDNLV
jgi:hypothetical protein